ncbi:hypothetical protein [Streptomyces nitrosporeus]|uniref:hypothetical protein n=1 Tax=Streptomyces nitrosporeus TaxID=28894 RepID=UPI0039A0CE06
MPGEAEAAPIEVLAGDIYTDDPDKAERRTLFDGAGGVAGIPFTDEQREALVKEAKRRGLDDADAYALAYGDGAKVTVLEDGTTHVDTSEVVLANGPVYRKAKKAAGKASGNAAQSQVAGGSKKPVTESEKKGNSKADSGKKEPSAKRHTQEDPQGQGSGEGKSRTGGKEHAEPMSSAAAPEGEPYYPGSGKNPYDKGLGEALKDMLNPFSKFMEMLAGPVTAPVVVEKEYGGRVTLTTTSRINPRLEVAVDVSTAFMAPGEPVSVSAAATDPRTGAVLSKTSPAVVDEPDEVSNAAIGEAVEAVVTAVVAPAVNSFSQEPGDEFPDGFLDLQVVPSLEPLDELTGRIELREAA